MDKINTQIAVLKNSKTCIEFLDRLKFDSDSAQIENSYSRIRIGIQDYSGNSSVYKWANVTSNSIRTIYSALCSIRVLSSAAVEESAVRDMENLKSMLLNNPGIENKEISFIDSLISKYKSSAESKKKPIILFEEKKILSYDSYRNPNNNNEYLITGIKVTYNASMRIPVVFEISHGYGTATKDNTGRVKYSGEHDTITLKKMLTVTEAKMILSTVIRFCDNMTNIASENYFKQRFTTDSSNDNNE